MENLDLKSIEKKAMNAIDSDGLMDIMWGLMFILSAVNLILNHFVEDFNTPMYIIAIAMMPIFLQSMRKKYTYPRIGYAKPKSNKSLIILLAALVFVQLVVMVALFVMRNKGISSPKLTPAAFFTLISISPSIVFLGIGYARKIKRFFYYAIFPIPVLSSWYFLQKEPLLIFAIELALIGIIMLIVGVVLFYRFLKSHEIQTDIPQEYGQRKPLMVNPVIASKLWRDGLYDILMGISVIAIVNYESLGILPTIYFIIGFFALIVILRLFVVFPTIEMESGRKKLFELKSALVVLATVLFIYGYMIFSSSRDAVSVLDIGRISTYHLLSFIAVLIIALGTFMTGVKFKMKRMVFYSIIMVLSQIILLFYPDVKTVFASAGFMVFLVGASMFFKFMQNRISKSSYDDDFEDYES